MAEGGDHGRPGPQLVLDDVRPGGLLAQMGVHASDQLVEPDRLGHEVVGPGAEPLDDAEFVTGAGHQEDGQGLGRRS